MSGRKPIVQCTATEWRELCRLARAVVPPPHRYAWRFVWSASMAKHGHDYGDSDLSPRPEALRDGSSGLAIVRVAKGLSHGHTLNIMIHEIAHAVDCWTPAANRGHHDTHYWIEHGRVYRAMMEAYTG